MKIRIELLSDTIFGSGMSIPGAEDISILLDRDNFPYLKGSTFRGVMREEAENYAVWTQKPEGWLEERFGTAGIDPKNSSHYVSVTDFELPMALKDTVKKEGGDPQELFTSFRTFTSLEDGIAKDSTLRIARCVNKGFVFYGDLSCAEEDEEELEEIISSIRFIGSMRTRGFGHVKVSRMNPKQHADPAEQEEKQADKNCFDKNNTDKNHLSSNYLNRKER